MNLNKAMIIGNLTRDPEVRSTSSGTTVANFAVATNFIWNDNQGQRQERAEFHNVVAWRKLGEICGQYLKKGSKVYIEGRLQTSEWTGNDQTKRYKTEIVAENMIMLDRAGAAGGGSFGNKDNYSQAQPQSQSYEEPSVSPDQGVSGGGQQQAQSGPNDEEEIKVENIPF